MFPFGTFQHNSRQLFPQSFVHAPVRVFDIEPQAFRFGFCLRFRPRSCLSFFLAATASTEDVVTLAPL
jgi:hypothetical protein